MNYVYIYAAIGIAYQVFRFVRGRQKAAEEQALKAQQSVQKRNFETVSTAYRVEIKEEKTFAEGYGYDYHQPESSRNYENQNTKPLVENITVKAYENKDIKKAAMESRSFDYKIVAENKHPLLKGFKKQSEIQKAFIYAEILKTKF